MATIIPAIIPKNLEDLSEKMELVSELVDIVQIDAIDGRYAKPASWPYTKGSSDFESIVSGDEDVSWKQVNFEADLMVSKPEEELERWVMAGASRVVVHYESTTPEKIKEIIEDYEGAFVEIGLAIKPSTPSQKLEEFIEEIDFIQCMGSDKIGRSGEKLEEKVYDKIRDIRDIHPEIPISVDIGVDFETAPKLIEAGVNRLVAGSAIFESGDIEETIREFQEM